MEIELLAFGIAREICGGSAVKLETPDVLDCAELKDILLEKYPRLGALASFLLAVNEEFALPEQKINAGDEVAIIPPVSGG